MESKMYLSTLVEKFWSPHFWFGETKITWDDFVDVNTSTHEVMYPIVAGLLLLITRGTFSTYAIKFISSFKPKTNDNRSKKVSKNKILEEIFYSLKTSSRDLIIKEAIKEDISEREAERWLRNRLKEDAKTQKLFDTSMRAIYYTFMGIYGISIIYEKPWLWNTRKCWDDYPRHRVDDKTRRYYLIQLTFYWYLTFSQVSGDSTKKRKDFWQMLLHHIATITLISFSWVSNKVRVGMLVVVLHDMADIALEIAKMCLYANFQKTSTTMYKVFAVTWIITRLYIFPKYVIYSTMYELPEIIGIAPADIFMIAFLIVLQILHVFWTYFLIKGILNFKKKGTVEKDERSDSDDSD